MKMRTIVGLALGGAVVGGLGFWGYRKYTAGKPVVTPVEVHTTSHTPPKPTPTESPETPMPATAQTTPAAGGATIADVIGQQAVDALRDEVPTAEPLPKMEGLSRQQRRKLLKYFNGFVNTVRTGRWVNTSTEIFTLLEHENRVMITLERHRNDGTVQNVAVMREGAILTASVDGEASETADAVTDAVMVMHFAMRVPSTH